jgi:tetratricopeptide (TPR) repeat protein
MRSYSIALALIALLAGPAAAVDVIEMKDGKVYAVESAELRGERIFLQLHFPKKDKEVGFSVPISRVVPEFVYYVWDDQILPGDHKERVRLGEWARANGIFSLALKQYEKAAEQSAAIRNALPELRARLHEEEATWLFNEAERLFREDEVKVARARAQRILADFTGTAETGRAKELLSMISEREKFLTDERRKQAIARRAAKQRRAVEQHLSRIGRAERLLARARVSYTADTRRRLLNASYYYRKAILDIDEMLPFVEVKDLRSMMETLLGDLHGRMLALTLRLADVRYMTGDYTGALGAVHEVMAADPNNKAARRLRERIMDRRDFGYGWGYGGPVWHSPWGLYHWRRGHIHPRSLGYRFGRPNRQVDLRFGGQRSIVRYPVYDLEPSHAVSRPHKIVDLRFGGQRTIWQVPAYDLEPMNGR